MRRLMIVRHAPVAISGICYGQSEVPTTVSAEEAAQVILKQLETPTQVRTIWSSPWKRCREPAELLATLCGASLRIDARLSELNFGEWERRSYDALEREDGERFRGWMEDWKTAAPPGGETVTNLVDRVRDVLADIRDVEGDILVMTHAGVLRAASMLLNGGIEFPWSDPAEHLRVRDWAL